MVTPIFPTLPHWSFLIFSPRYKVSQYDFFFQLACFFFKIITFSTSNTMHYSIFTLFCCGHTKGSPLLKGTLLWPTQQPSQQPTSPLPPLSLLSTFVSFPLPQLSLSSASTCFYYLCRHLVPSICSTQGCLSTLHTLLSFNKYSSVHFRD